MTTNFTDWLAICETKARYCRCMDTKDWAGYADCFTEDYELDTTPIGGYKIAGRDAVMKAVLGSIEHARTAHQVHNPEIVFDADGQGADVIWAMNDRVEMAEDRREAAGEYGHTGYGHYHERYVKCPDGKWRIKTNRLSYLHFDQRPYPG